MTSQLTVLVKATTWSRESHGLFDYETKVQTRANLRVNESAAILRRESEVFMCSLDRIGEELKDGVKLLSVVLFKSGTVLLLHDVPGRKTPKQFIDRMWLVVSSLHAPNLQGYRLSAGEIMRLGRISFRIKELVCASETPAADAQPRIVHGRAIIQGGLGLSRPKPLVAESPIILTIADEVETKGGEKIAEVACKICLMDTFSEENPMITPCTCKGTMRYIHLECLQRWLDSKITTRERGNSRSYSWKSLECTLCKTPFPSSVMISGKCCDLVNIPRPEGDFLTLEAVQRDRELPQTIHLIPLQNKNNVRLGRGHDSDVRISDISVSRNHALVRYQQGHLYLEDNESKFGTLVQVRKPISLDQESAFSIQCGRTVLNFACRSRTRCFSCFGCGHAQEEEAEPLDQLDSLEQDSSEEERNFTEESMHEVPDEDEANPQALPS